MISVIPLNDLEEHTEVDCKCNPTVEIVNGIVISTHNSFDCRELTEDDVIFMLN